MADIGCQTEQTPAPRKKRVWLLASATLITSIIAAWLLGSYAYAPILATWLVVAAVGSILIWPGGAGTWGIVSWVVAAVIMAGGFWTPASLNDFIFPSGAGFAAGGFIFSLLAGIIFLVSSLRNRSTCVGNCAGFMVVLFSFAIYASAGSTMRHYRARPEAVQETRQLLLTLHQLAAEIETIHKQLGRLPEDESELVALRGKPMPAFFRDYRVHYTRRDSGTSGGDGDYSLNCSAQCFWGDGWDLFGWIVEFFGPDSTPRVRAILF